MFFRRTGLLPRASGGFVQTAQHGDDSLGEAVLLVQNGRGADFHAQLAALLTESSATRPGSNSHSGRRRAARLGGFAFGGISCSNDSPEALFPSGSPLLYTEEFKAMQKKYSIGILGATGMVGQRYIQLLENHPWFEVTWLAASDRSSGKPYGDAAKRRLDPPLPEPIAQMPVAPADAEGAPKIVFASVDAAIAREMEPRFAEAGCAVLSNSSAFRMAPNVPLVIPEINAGHLQLIEKQPSRKDSGGYMVTNPNCSTIGLVMVLKPIQERFGIE